MQLYRTIIYWLDNSYSYVSVTPSDDNPAESEATEVCLFPQSTTRLLSQYFSEDKGVLTSGS